MADQQTVAFWSQPREGQETQRVAPDQTGAGREGEDGSLRSFFKPS